MMRSVKMNVGNKPVGTALTWAYPNGQGYGAYVIPTYQLTVSGKDSKGVLKSKDFEVLRFGILCKHATDKPTVVGLAEQQTHIIKAWLPHYTVHSARSSERGAWQVYGGFLIHDGPDDPKKEIYASIGCIELCGGPRGFDIFNDFVIELSGAVSKDRARNLIDIGSAKNISITYEKAARPVLRSA